MHACLCGSRRHACLCGSRLSRRTRRTQFIGATSHFVTAELDCGPIIEQMVERVSHRDSLRAFADKSRTLEKNCLFVATRLYSEDRVVRCRGGSRVAVLQ